MINGTRYHPDIASRRFDAIVIGSGLGGLTTAALLAKAGQRVLVLERHYTAGGFTHSFRRRGYEWDVGAEFGTPRKLLVPNSHCRAKCVSRNSGHPENCGRNSGGRNSGHPENC